MDIVSKPKESIEYFVYPNPVKHHGINNKIEQTIMALEKRGHNAKKVTSDPGIKGVIKLMIKIASTDANIIIFRNTFLMPFFVPSIIWARIKGKKAIVDLPTPVTNVLQEFKTRSHIGNNYKAIRIAMVAITYPWVLLPFNKILQYAPESKYFSLFIKNKTVRIANGINVADFPPKLDHEKWSGNKLTLIAVANMASWHGFDRIIKGLAHYMQSEPKTMVKFIIVGGGQAKDTWEKLTIELGVAKYVEFVGFKKDEELNELFEEANIAVSSLGLFRINIDEASVLKSREYTARGIPFIAAGIDIDYNPNPDFIYKVENREVQIDIGKIVEWYVKLKNNKQLNKDIRDYAFKKLDFQRKITDFLPFGN